MESPVGIVLKFGYLLICAMVIVLTLLQNRRSEGLGAAITGQGDTSRGAMGREEKLADLIKNVSWFFLAASFGVAYILRQLWR
jgi:protein translocase SecG subunit